MKKINIIFLSLVILTSCGQSTSGEVENEGGGDLPNEIISTDEGYELLKDSIIADYSNLEDEMEVLEFSYNCSLGSSDELSSSIDVQFVKGNDKNAVAEYSIDNEGSLSRSDIEISIGDFGKQKISNSYETYKPFLFSSKLINIDVVRKCISSSIEQFKKDANCPEAYCASASIEYDNRGELEISISIVQKKFVTMLRRSYHWTIDGKQKD